MLIELGVLMIGRAPQVTVFTLEITWCREWAKSKIQSLYQQLKLNTLQRQAIVHNYYGWRTSYKIMKLLKTLSVFCENMNAINLSKNPVQHSKSKHIEIWYHFIRDLVEDKIVCLEFINTDKQKADIFTKPLDHPKFEYLRKTIGVGIIPWTPSFVWPYCVHCCILLV